jgi:hypothetical protein
VAVGAVAVAVLLCGEASRARTAATEPIVPAIAVASAATAMVVRFPIVPRISDDLPCDVLRSVWKARLSTSFQQ